MAMIPPPYPPPTEQVSTTAPKLCINCAYIGTNASRDATKYICFAPQNTAGVDLVTGTSLTKAANCYSARAVNEHCGNGAAWYTLAPPKPEPLYSTHDTATINDTADKLRAQLRAKTANKLAKSTNLADELGF